MKCLDELAKKTAGIGGRAYLVGGCVRDGLMRRERRDVDVLIVGAREEDIAQVLRGAKRVGGTFPVFRASIGGEVVEIALARTERKTSAGHRGFNASFSPDVTLEEDLSRRDITINAIAQDILTGEIADPFGGVADVEARMIRRVSDAFADDPLRALRAARISAELSFDITPDTIDAMRSCAREIPTLSTSRVVAELDRALATPKPSVFFRALERADVLKASFPLIHALIGRTQRASRHPEGDAFEHTMAMLDFVAARGADATTIFCALMHDVGKGETPDRDLPLHPGHDDRGARIIAALPSEYSTAKKRAAEFVARYHMRAKKIVLPSKAVELLEALDRSGITPKDLTLILEGDGGRVPRWITDEALEEVVRSKVAIPPEMIGDAQRIKDHVNAARIDRAMSVMKKAEEMITMDDQNKKFRTEHDSMGEVQVPADRYWGAQTERSRTNFRIGVGLETMPREIIRAFGVLKKAAAIANRELRPEKMTAEKLDAISRAADEVIAGSLDDHFPLVVWQTGSGTQSNMNANEVIARRGAELTGTSLHPNDDVNMSQSSNDTFPTAMHIAAAEALEDRLIPSVDELIATFAELERDHEGVVKSGRTHLQDATPISFSQEISGWRASLERDRAMIVSALPYVKRLALGGTAVGTGLNAPKGFDAAAARAVSQITGREFITDENKFHALTSKDELVFAHGAMKALACDMMKIANDVRWLASGPRDGLGEIRIPENEPGSSIMPGKVNPTQCEQATMVAVQVIGNDTAVAFAASQGNFELNVFMPVCIYNFLQSARLLAESIKSFNDNCAVGIVADREKMRHNLHDSLMLVTALNPYIGYENAAKTAKLAYARGISLKDACVELGFLTPEKFDEVFHPEQMI